MSTQTRLANLLRRWIRKLLGIRSPSLDAIEKYQEWMDKQYKDITEIMDKGKEK